MGIVMLFLSGLAFIEIVGYIYHRWIEHGEIMKFIKRNAVLDKILHLHWTHHAKNYPPENLRPDNPYVTDDNLSWYLPGAVITVAVFLTAPLVYALPFASGAWTYGLLIDRLHARFHLKNHFLADKRFFLYLQKIHDIHHMDQTKNFTIVVPALDILFDTYLDEYPAPYAAARA
ncbi:MAG: sterol desaturase family protein [Elusimicrobia bacterium]|nr:sterol desaturase family protein [Elusimicrobiota bacterium]